VDAGMSKEVENISFGVFSPLEGFLCREDYLSVLHTKRLLTEEDVMELDEKVKKGILKKWEDEVSG